MILLNKLIYTNKIVATATEGITLSGDTSTGFTMIIENNMDNKITELDLTDTSLFPDRYNEFDFDNSAITSLNEGLYDYGIYYTVEDDTELVEIGIMKIYSDEEIIPTYDYDDNDDDTYFSYEN